MLASLLLPIVVFDRAGSVLSCAGLFGRPYTT